MSLVPSLNNPTTGQARVPAPLVANDNAIRDVVNGNLDYTNLADSGVTTAKIAAANVTADKLADAAKLGLSDSTYVRRGKSIIATAETFTQTSYGYATTPDRVQNVVLPTDGLIFVAFEAAWQQSASGAAEAGIFLGATQLAVDLGQGVNESESAHLSNITGAYRRLVSCPVGLATWPPNGAPADPATTGQVLGGLCLATDSLLIKGSTSGAVSGGERTPLGGAVVITAAAGTYDIGIKYKSSSGSVTVKNRKLWVWTQSF